MTKNAYFVPGVPGLCRVLCRVFHSCAGCAGSTSYARAPQNKKTHTHKCALPRICTRHTRHTRHMLDSYRYFHTSPGTPPGTPGTGIHTTPKARARLPLIFIFKKEVMEKAPNQPPVTKTIRCTPDNAAEMQRLVKAWPELHALVQSLQAQDLFPGLRGLSITLTGSEQFVAKGLAAVTPTNAPQAV